MNFNSLAFLIYLPVVVGLLLGPALQGPEILAPGSLVLFLYVLEPGVPLFAALSTAVDYCCGRGIEANRERKDLCRFFLGCSLCMNLGLLFFFKYFDFSPDPSTICAHCGTFPTGFPGWG